MIVLLVLGIPPFGLAQSSRLPPRGSPPRTPVVRELPEVIDEEIPGGLSLDAAIQQLVTSNRELAATYQEIPKARADILSASLIENPSVFLDAGGIPYGNYSPRRPGETEYEITAVQPFDVSGKRRNRIRVAQRAEKVLEALFQNAIRKKIEELSSVYVEVLEARLNARAAERAVTWLTSLTETTRGLAKQGIRSRSDVAEIAVRLAQARIAREQADASLLQAQRRLALLLNLPSERAAELVLSGSLRDRYPPPPATEQLIEAALRTRPDLAAHRLSVERALARINLTRSEKLEDILVFYTPYQSTTFPGQPETAALGWETGALVVLPVFDRKQGEMVRARVSVTQLRMQTQTLERTILHEVRGAAMEYAASREDVQRFEKEILPSVRRDRDDRYRQFTAGRLELDALLDAEKDYRESADQYVEALVRHRRAMLKLNAAVGQRLLP